MAYCKHEMETIQETKERKNDETFKFNFASCTYVQAYHLEARKCKLCGKEKFYVVYRGLLGGFAYKEIDRFSYASEIQAINILFATDYTF